MELRKMILDGKRSFGPNVIPLGPIKGLNVIIGENNAGKSTLCDMISSGAYRFRAGDYLTGALYSFSPEDCVELIDSEVLSREFDCASIQDVLFFAKEYLSTKDHGNYYSVSPAESLSTNAPESFPIPEFKIVAECFGSAVLRIDADRNLAIEGQQDHTQPPHLKADGTGIPAMLHNTYNYTTNSKRHHEREILQALTRILPEEKPFTEVRPAPTGYNGPLELQLRREGEEKWSFKEFGSGIRTILSVLAILICQIEENKVTYGQENEKGCRPIIIFEELENNLHPATLRRLLEFIYKFQQETKLTFFITTHSAVVLDFFADKKDVSMFRVTRKDGVSSVANISDNHQQWDALCDLGFKASDLLQSNGIIWVEGVTDRIYLNRLIELWSDNKLREGEHYTLLSYGGSCIATTRFDETEELSDEFVKALSVSRNVFLVADRDKASEAEPLKQSLQDAITSIEKLGDRCGSWVTAGREFENYLTGPMLQSVYSTAAKQHWRDPDQFEPLWTSEAKYWSEHGFDSKPDKKKLAQSASALMTRENMEGRYDLDAKMKELIKKIREWNE